MGFQGVIEDEGQWVRGPATHCQHHHSHQFTYQTSANAFLWTKERLSQINKSSKPSSATTPSWSRKQNVSLQKVQSDPIGSSTFVSVFQMWHQWTWLEISELAIKRHLEIFVSFLDFQFKHIFCISFSPGFAYIMAFVCIPKGIPNWLTEEGCVSLSCPSVIKKHSNECPWPQGTLWGILQLELKRLWSWSSRSL